mmetsp:Transcript_84289/g.239504  ORF Transcript_84289/g.239504 Transcript_84289/m.239504 type:complete len:325 (+) Transcript_84289:775-1749(+)
MEIKLTHDEKLRLVWGGELPQTPYDMHKALERLWRWEFDEKIAEKDKHRERVEKRRQARLKFESNKGSARVMQVRKVHREANRLAMEQVQQQQGVVEKLELKQQAAEVRREVAAVERTTEWHSVRLRPHKPPMEPVPGITPGGADEDSEAAVTEDVFVYFTLADPVDDSELGETWIMDKVEERYFSFGTRVALTPNFPTRQHHPLVYSHARAFGHLPSPLCILAQAGAAFRNSGRGAILSHLHAARVRVWRGNHAVDPARCRHQGLGCTGAAAAPELEECAPPKRIRRWGRGSGAPGPDRGCSGTREIAWQPGEERGGGLASCF